MVSLLYVVATVLAAIFAAVNGQTTVNGKPVAPGSVVFFDNFTTLDNSLWQHEKTMSGGGNWEFQVYENTRSNSYCKNGILYLKPTMTEDRYGAGFVTSGTLDLNGGAPADECTNPSYYGCARTGSGSNGLNPIMSARIRTVNSFSFKYGIVEVRAKMPSGDWLWPAIWLLPRHNQYGTWPASGEIDLVESRGNANLMMGATNIGNEQVSSTLHWGPYWPHNGYAQTGWSRNSAAGQGYDKTFHDYKVEWTPDSIQFSLDGTVLGRVAPPASGFWGMGGFPADIENPWDFAKGGTKMAPFDQEFYIIINLAVGGTNGFFPPNSVPPPPWGVDNALGTFWNARGQWQPTWVGENAALQVDYVKVTAL